MIVPIWAKLLIIASILGGVIYMADRQFVKPWRDKAHSYEKLNEQKDKQIEEIGSELNKYLQDIIEVINEENTTTPSTLGNLTTG
jgi:predicted RNA-binding protein Jag